jgi:two-component system phosphate regulon sensor histidine kinase PhoR
VIIAFVVIIAIAIAAAGVSAVLAQRARRRKAHVASEFSRVRAILEANERRRVAAFDHLPLAALWVDDAGRIREINAIGHERFPHVAPGGGMLASFGEHRFADEVALALASGENRSFEVRLFADERRTYRVSVEPITGLARPEALVFMTDFTDAVAYQELRSQFSANVSHELRTPLTGLAGLVEALGDPEMDPDTHARFVDRAANEIQRLVALISDVLFLSELEATQGLEPVTRSDLRLSIANAIEVLGDVADEHHVTITVVADQEIWTPLTERMSMTVVQNLIENAIKYGGPGSETVVAAKLTPDDLWVELICRDTGPGIPERHLPHIFERFYRADASRSKRLGGTGLGLSIVKHIAERFGGEVGATSREGFGTTVRVRLPVVLGDRATAGLETREDPSFTSTR